MCIPKLSIPNQTVPGAAPPPNQPAATVNQANPINSALGANNSGQRGVAGLTIPLTDPALGGLGPSGLGIPTS